MEKIIIKPTCLELPNYEYGDCQKLEKSLSMWDNDRKISVPLGMDYNPDTRTLYVPRGIDINFVAKITNRVLEKSRDIVKPQKAFINLKYQPRDDIQKKSIQYLIGQGAHKVTANYSQKALTLPPGDGKTFVTIAALSYIREKSLIITHLDRLQNQWYKSLKEFTSLENDDICCISGSSGIEKLIKLHKKGKLHYRIYLINHGTLQSYGSNHGWDKLHDLFEMLGIGVKVYDEAHLNFANILQLDFHTSVRQTIYLTATFRRTDRNEQKVFDLCFKNISKYGEELTAEKRKHINYFVATYDSKPSLQDRASIKNYYGFSKMNYSNYQMECPKFYKAIDTLVDKFITIDGTILLLVSKIEACDILFDYLKKRYPDENVTVLHSKVEGKERETALEGSIIVSTPQSSGTGIDIRGLRFCIMCEPYSSLVTADQVSGRLREYDSESFSIYVELVDSGFKEVVNMYKRRKPFFKKKCNRVLTIDIE